MLKSLSKAVLKPTSNNKVASQPETSEGVSSEAKEVEGNDGLRRLLFHTNTLVIERLGYRST